MAEKDESMKTSAAVIEEIEAKIEDLWLKRKGEVESELEERIKVERETAAKKIEAIEKELGKGRAILKDYRSVVSEFESERASLQRQIKEHFEKAVGYQTEIEKMAGQTMEELRLVNDLSKKLEAVQHSAEDKVNTFRKDLEERFGIEAQLPEAKEEDELKVDLEQELIKLRKIKELLEAESVVTVESVEGDEVEVETPGEEEREEGNEARESTPATLPEVDNGIPPASEVVEQSVAEEAEEAEEAGEESERSEEPAAGEKALKGEKENFQNLFEALEKFRRVEARNGNGEVSFFQNEDKIVLDGEYMVASIDESMEEAKRLYLKLDQTDSPKEQFFIKQEIINHQEILRKYILRNLKMCDKENASLPGFTAEILNVEILRDFLEKLSMENWSNPAEFNGFRAQIEALKDSYYARITPPVNYLRSLIEELGA
jgi:DNA repair exonuclease SbcCD ATPase subunit